MPQSTLMPTGSEMPLENFHRCVRVGNWMMILSVMICAISILVTFKYDNLFTIQIQIVAHMSTIIFAGLFKLGYVIRCVGQQGLGKQEF